MNNLALGPDASRILLVDDDADVRRAMCRALSQAGMSVAEAENGDAAAALMAGSDLFDMLVTDVLMPGRRDGAALASVWREQAPGRPVLFVSGFNGGQVDAAGLGPHEAMLFKPFLRALLVSTVRTLLTEASQASGWPFPRRPT